MKPDIIEIINKQKRSAELSDSELKFLVRGYTAGEIPDYQMSAWLMAVCLTGMSDRACAVMTEYMAKSGRRLDFSSLGVCVTDKHSTGGVGDKVTLIAVPCAAACGAMIAKISGRGLGFTGGTIDKLSAIRGFKTELPFETVLENMSRVGAVMISSGAELAPADKKIYALRDVTGTVDSIPLIASSVMSKKIACGANAVVLDVKYGSGAFMKDRTAAGKLCDLMRKIGSMNGIKTECMLSDMNTPLGRAIGNSLEVIEAIEVLRGGGEADIRDNALEAASLMLSLSVGIEKAEARERVEASISSGAAYKKFCEIISAQGGDPDNLDFDKSDIVIEVKSDKAGVIGDLNTEGIGRLACRLGAGREAVDSAVDYSAGIILEAKPGCNIKPGDVLARLYTNKRGHDKEFISEYLNCLEVK